MFDFESVQQLRQTGQYEAAKAVVRQYVETAPNDPTVLYQMAWCHDSLGEEHAAVPYYEQALALGLTGETACRHISGSAVHIASSVSSKLRQTCFIVRSVSFRTPMPCKPSSR